MVKATSKSASKCGPPGAVQTQTEDCQKSDSTYDLLLADFAFPDTDSVPVLVCDGSIYSVGEWIQFTDSEARVQIVAINVNELTVKGICSNGSAVFRNPTAGTIIRKNEAIVVIDSPDCLTDEEQAEKLSNDLSSIEEICAPSLTEEGSTSAEQQMTGWTRADSANPGFTKCIKRVIGNWFKNGIPYFSNLRKIATTGKQVLIIDPATHEVSRAELDSLSTPAQQYTWAPSFDILASLGTDYNDPSSWIKVNDGDTKSFTLDLNITSLNDLNIGRDFYAILKIDLGATQGLNYGAQATLKINGTVEGQVYSYTKAYGTSSVMVTVPVDKTTRQITLDLETESYTNGKYFLQAKLQGVMM